MATWDTSMPLSLANGTLVDEGDMNPLLANVNSLRYATVFLGGQQRITTVSGIGGTETQVLTTPAVEMTNGMLYKVEGMMVWRSSASGTRIAVLVRQGATVAGPTVQAYTAYNADVSDADYMAPFSIYVKATSDGTQQYCLGTRIQSGAGAVTVMFRSWIAVLRSGDASLMAEV